MKMKMMLTREVKQQRREWAHKQKHSSNIPDEIVGRKNS
jgi:hypothetical protein